MTVAELRQYSVAMDVAARHVDIAVVIKEQTSVDVVEVEGAGVTQCGWVRHFGAGDNEGLHFEVSVVGCFCVRTDHVAADDVESSSMPANGRRVHSAVEGHP